MDRDGQLTFDDDPFTVKYKKGIHNLELGHFDIGLKLFNELFEEEPNNETLILTIKGASFWNNRIEQISEMEVGLKKGRFLLNEWKKFEIFLGENSNKNSSDLGAISHFVFSEAIHCLTRSYNESRSPDIRLIYDIGICYFSINDYKRAVETFEYAWEFKRNNSKVIAKLADSYYALSEKDEKLAQKAKLLFREAFLYKPQEIDLQDIKADFIVNLKNGLIEEGFSGNELNVWIPIRASQKRILNVKREIDDSELLLLTDECQQLEDEIEKDGSDSRILVPLLLNRYIWLIDHYLLGKNDSVQVELLRKKYREIDPDNFITQNV